MFGYLMQLLALAKQTHTSVCTLVITLSSIEERLHAVNLDKTNGLLQEILDEVKAIRKCVCGDEIVGIDANFNKPQPR